jgi:hypothetical protein
MIHEYLSVLLVLKAYADEHVEVWTVRKRKYLHEVPAHNID